MQGMLANAATTGPYGSQDERMKLSRLDRSLTASAKFLHRIWTTVASVYERVETIGTSLLPDRHS